MSKKKKKHRKPGNLPSNSNPEAAGSGAARLPGVKIYTDGACKPNPGPGGWAAILLHPGQKPIELVGSEEQTTSNRMELTAAFEALKALSGRHQVHLYTDSRYVQKGMTQWLSIWERRNWQTSEQTEVKNQDLWRALAEKLKEHAVSWHYIRGHVGSRWNMRADKLATAAIPELVLPLQDDQAIHIFTAASYLGQERRGAWAVLLRYQERRKTLSCAVSNTSGNQMHLLSAIAGLRAVRKDLPIHLYTRSDYLKDGATIWLPKWLRRNWTTLDGHPVAHEELWKALAGLSQKLRIHWHLVTREALPEEMVAAKALATSTVRLDSGVQTEPQQAVSTGSEAQ